MYVWCYYTSQQRYPPPLSPLCYTLTSSTTTMMMHAIRFDNPGDEFHLANVPRPTPQKVLLLLSPSYSSYHHSHHCAWLHYAIITTHSPPFPTHTLHLLFTNTLYSPQLSRSPPSPSSSSPPHPSSPWFSSHMYTGRSSCEAKIHLHQSHGPPGKQHPLYYLHI